MRILFLNLASHPAPGLNAGPGEIACVTEEKVVSIVEVDHRMSDADVPTTIEKVLSDAGWSYQDLTHIACVTGPGGFTSLRVAVSAVNTLSDQLGIPSVGIHVSDLISARVEQRAEDRGQKTEVREGFIWLHSTTRTQLFARGFGSFASQWPEPVLLSLDDLVSSIPNKALLAGELLLPQREALDQKHIREADLVPVSDALPRFLSEQMYGKTLLMPWYGRGY